MSADEDMISTSPPPSPGPPPPAFERMETMQAGENERALRQLRARVYAEEVLASEAAEVLGRRRKTTARQFAAEPAPPVVLAETLAAEINLLSGPDGAGKSLLARDWALAVASGAGWLGRAVTEPRSVLWVASEGLHDVRQRWAGQPLWDAAADQVWMLDSPPDLRSRPDVDWLLAEYAEQRPGLVVFDVIYGCGVANDNESAGVIQVLASMKRISAEWGAATLALGHPGHNGERRFRGSSMWGQLAYTDWHLGGGLLTCRKSKIARASEQARGVVAEYPGLVWTTSVAGFARAEEAREEIVAADVRMFPGDSVRERAKRLAAGLGVGEERARKVIRELLKPSE